MIPRSPLGLAVLAAATANALMVPSTMTLSDAELDWTQELRSSLDSITRVSESHFLLDCPGCGFPDPSNDDGVFSEVENGLMLDFTLSDDRSMLFLNKVPFYPFSVSLSRPIYVSQMTVASLAEDDPTELATSGKPRQLFYAGGYRKAHAADGSMEELIDLDFTITGLDQEQVAVDGLAIRLFEDGNGKLSIGNILTVPRANPRPTRPESDHNTSCGTGLTSVLCRWRSFVESKVSTFGQRPGCAGRLGAHQSHGPPFIKGGPSKFQHPPTIDGENSPSHHGHHHLPTADGEIPPSYHGHHPHHHGHHHHHHHSMHRVGSAIRYITVSFLIPVLVGVAAGMAASVLGMMVGTAIAWLWIKLVRGGRKGRDSTDRVVAAAKEEIFVECEGLLDEKKGFMEEESEVEALPLYVEKE